MESVMKCNEIKQIEMEWKEFTIPLLGHIYKGCFIPYPPNRRAKKKWSIGCNEMECIPSYSNSFCLILNNPKGGGTYHCYYWFPDPIIVK
jgi:hypothetical protein